MISPADRPACTPCTAISATKLPLEQVIAEVPVLENGGTLDVLLANHALTRGYSARIFTYNVQMFDPTWFRREGVDLAERLRLQLEHKDSDAPADRHRGVSACFSSGGASCGSKS